MQLGSCGWWPCCCECIRVFVCVGHLVIWQVRFKWNCVLGACCLRNCRSPTSRWWHSRACGQFDSNVSSLSKKTTTTQTHTHTRTLVLTHTRTACIKSRRNRRLHKLLRRMREMRYSWSKSQQYAWPTYKRKYRKTFLGSHKYTHTHIE